MNDCFVKVSFQLVKQFACELAVYYGKKNNFSIDFTNKKLVIFQQLSLR